MTDLHRHRFPGAACAPPLFAAFAAFSVPARADDTAAIQAMIDRAGAKGGAVSLAAQTYAVGTLNLKSHVTLRLPAGCVLNESAPLQASHVDHIAIVGDGTINETVPNYVVVFRAVDRFQVRGVTINGYNWAGGGSYGTRPGGYWTCPCWDCSHGEWKGITLHSDTTIQWCDGIDLSNCHDIAVTDCRIIAGDDGVSVKAFSPAFYSHGSWNITVTGCTFTEPGAGMPMGIGSETYQPIHDITFAGNTVTRAKNRPYKLWLARHDEKDWLAADQNLPSGSTAPVYNIRYRDNHGDGADTPDGISLQGATDQLSGITFNGVPVTELKATNGKTVTLGPADRTSER